MQSQNNVDELNKDVNSRSLLERQKSKSSLSLLWEELSGGPLDLQSYVENCWNTIRIVDINIDNGNEDQVEANKSEIIEDNNNSQLYKDSGNSSLHDEEQNDINVHIGSSNGTIFRNNDRVNKWSLVIQELLDTETAYLSSLKEIEEGYMDMLINDYYDDYQKDIEIIFCNWKELSKFHILFLAEIRGSIKKGLLGLEQLAQCFLKFSNQFENLYTTYCINYIRSVKHLNRMENTKLWKYFENCQATLCHKLPLSTYLLKPVQRILKYQLILQELIQSCKSIKVACELSMIKIEKKLLCALEEMVLVAERINHKQTEEELRSEIIQTAQEICHAFYQIDGVQIEVDTECILNEMRILGGSKNRRTVLLCKGGLVVAKNLLYTAGSSVSSMTYGGSNCIGKWEIKCFIESCGMKLVENIPKNPLGFHVVDNNKPSSKVSLVANDADMKETWCTMIKQRIIDSYHGGITEKKRQILLDKKYNVLSRQIPCNIISTKEGSESEEDPGTDHDDEDPLDIHKTLNQMFGEFSNEILNNKKSPTSTIRREDSKYSKNNHKLPRFQDPSIHQEQRINNRQINLRKIINEKEKNKNDYEYEDGDDLDGLDCRSVLVEVNEEILQYALSNKTGQSNKEIQQTYNKYIEMSRNSKSQINKEDSKQYVSSKSEIETLRMADDDGDDEDDVISSISCGSSTTDQIRRKSASMDRNLTNSTCHDSTPLTTSAYHHHNNHQSSNNSTQHKSNSYNSGNHTSIFSSVRGLKNFRSNSDWTGATLADSHHSSSSSSSIKPGIVKSISRLFRVPSRSGSKKESSTNREESRLIKSPSSEQFSQQQQQLQSNAQHYKSTNRKPRAPPVPVPEKPPRTSKSNTSSESHSTSRARSTSPRQIHSIRTDDISPTIPFKELVSRFQR